MEITKKLTDYLDYAVLDALFSEQPPPYSQLSVSILPMKEYFEKNSMIIPMISKLKIFFLISNIIYFLWGVLAFVLMMTISSCSTPNFSVWSAYLMFNGAINIFVVLLCLRNTNKSFKSRIFLYFILEHHRISLLCYLQQQWYINTMSCFFTIVFHRSFPVDFYSHFHSYNRS